jgi:uncharacterized protein
MLNKFKINDQFWSPYQSLIKDVVIPFQKSVLSDEIENIEKSHAIENFRICAGESNGEFYGMVFQDSDVAKWLEAVSYSLAIEKNPQLEEEVDSVIALVGKAQQPDGYLNTYFTIKEPYHRWQNLQEGHELYCAGHMIEAGVAHFEATGKTTLLDIVKKNANNICDTFGKNKRRGFPGHPEIELALVRLYHATGEKKYLDLAVYFINERGTSPNLFAEEKSNRDWSIWNSDPNDMQYTQNHMPVREQKNAVGHAVRAVYLYTAMADLVIETGDKSLYNACEVLWENITNKKMYITGGIGSTVEGEAFSLDYDLPNDSVYAETCASIGLIFFAEKMLKLSANSKYSDIMERALYNCVIAGMSLDGKKFFYTNPLEVNPEYASKTSIRKHICSERPNWFGCACCPPNVARLISSLDKYAWTEADDTIFSHLFIGGEIDLSDGKGLKIKTITDYPYKGMVTYNILTVNQQTDTTVAIRIPNWSKNYVITVNGEIFNGNRKDGYVYIKRKFLNNDKIVLSLDMTPRKVYSNLKVSGNSNCLAIQRGPFVYCIEGVDNGGELSNLRIVKDGEIAEKDFDNKLLGGIIPIEFDGVKLSNDNSLYTFSKPKSEAFTITAVPYYAWGNRGKNQMRVWICER